MIQVGFFTNVRNMPSNVTIPHTLIPKMIPCFAQNLLRMIPDPEKYLAFLKYIDEHDLWTAEFGLVHVLQDQVKSPHPMVFQAVLDTATKRDFCGFAFEPIFTDSSMHNGEQNLDQAQERLPVMEYLRTVPLEKLVEAIQNAGPQSPDILNLASSNPLRLPMLSLIYTHPRASSRINLFDYQEILHAIINEAWENVFPCTRRTTTPDSFFKLVQELQRENVKALAIISPFAFLSFSASKGLEYSQAIQHPDGFTDRQKPVAQKVLAEVAESVPVRVLIKWLVINKSRSPFGEACYDDQRGLFTSLRQK